MIATDRSPPTDSREVAIPPHGLPGTLTVPDSARGLVVFAHGSGSSRLSPRNTYVAGALRDARFGTLLFDLLTEAEACERRNVFDIPLLAGRLLQATRWLSEAPEARGLRLGYFGASTGAAAALVAAAEAGNTVSAVVSRGGRPDLAGEALTRVSAPTLLIVGGRDLQVLELNQSAAAMLRCEKAVHVVPGATHLFEEPGTLDEVIALSRTWFARYLPAYG